MRKSVAAKLKKPARKIGRSKLKPAEIELLFSRLQAKDPNPKGELQYVNPYTLLVAVVLSAQSTDVGVNRATKPLFAKVDSPQKMLALGGAKLVEAIRSLGFFNMKAKNVMRLSQILVDEYGGEVPREREALEKLPGVGRKTANVVLNIAFGEPVIAVDTHIFPRLEPHGAGARAGPRCGRRSPGEGRAGSLQAARAPLADPARPLRLHRAQAKMPRVRDRGHLPLQGQDGTGGSDGRARRAIALYPISSINSFSSPMCLSSRNRG